MRKLTLLLFLSALVFSGFAQVDTRSGKANNLRSTSKSFIAPKGEDALFYEGFESGSIDGWTLIDQDGDGYNWELMEIPEVAHSGDFYINSASWTAADGPITPENYLISPEIDLTEVTGTIYFEYYVGPVDWDWPSEHYELMYSLTGTDVADFTSVFEETIEVGDENGYSRRLFDISSFAGQTVYFAWVHNQSTDWYKIALDDISIFQPEAKILDFTADGGLGIPAEIDNDNLTVSYMVEAGTDLTDLTTEITASTGAQVTETTTDYTSPVDVIITSADHTIQNTYSVTVSEMAVDLVTVKDIQFTEDESGDSPLLDQFVKVNGIVTAAANNGIYIQDDAGAWNGIWVYTGEETGLLEGDSVQAYGYVDEYYNLTELALTKGSYLGTATPIAPAEIALADMVEPYEGVLVKLGMVTVADTANQYGEWLATDGTDTIKLDDKLFAVTPTVGDVYESITGIVDYSYGEYKLLPRSAEDLVPYVPSMVSVTFNVDMTPDAEFDATTDTVWITGNFAGWAEPGTEGSMFLTDDDEDMIYTLTIEVEENYGELLYKYFDGPSWDDGEWNGDPNRSLTVGTENVVVNDLWGTISVDAELLGAVELYPNPVKDVITLSSTEGVAEIYVSNVLGQTIIKTNTVTNTIDVSDLNKGIYIVTLVSENGTAVSERIVKE